MLTVTSSYRDSSSEMYSMTSTKRGMFIMISNEHFQRRSGLNRRNGAQQDLDMLHQVFTQLNFDVFIYSNVTAAKALVILEEGL